MGSAGLPVFLNGNLIGVNGRTAAGNEPLDDAFTKADTNIYGVSLIKITKQARRLTAPGDRGYKTLVYGP